MNAFYLITLILTMALTGCKGCSTDKPSCEAAKKYSDTAAGVFAPLLGCANVPAVAASFQSELEKLNLCEKPKEMTAGPISALVCGPLVKIIVGLPNRAAPAEWQCTGGTVGTVAETALTAACLQLPF